MALLEFSLAKNPLIPLKLVFSYISNKAETTDRKCFAHHNLKGKNAEISNLAVSLVLL